MKLILSLILIPSLVFSQEIPLKEGFVVFEQRDSTVAGTREELFDKAHEWVRSTLKKSLKDVKAEERKEGKIMITVAGTIPTELLKAPIENIEFIMTILTEDGRFSSEISEIIGWPSGGEEEKTSVDLLNYRYTKSNSKNKKDKSYSAEQREEDRATLQKVSEYMNAVQESLKEAMHR